jgi:hypothetical protein
VTDAISPRASLALGGLAPLACAAWIASASLRGRATAPAGPPAAVEAVAPIEEGDARGYR